MAGVNKAIELIKHVFTHTPIEVFTGRGLSTENVKQRTPEEITYLMELYKISGSLLDDFMKENHINFRRVGSPEWLTPDFVQYLENKQKEMNFWTNKYAVFCINYGGRDEILRGIQKRHQAGAPALTEELFSTYCDFWDLPPVELVIRTKGHLAQRTSGFLSRWLGYAELYFTEKKYPDLSIEEFEKALTWFDQVQEYRNFGK